MLWDLWKFREEDPSSANEKRRSPPITISVRLTSYVDAGQMRVRRRSPGPRDQDKNFGVKQRAERVHRSIGFRRCIICKCGEGKPRGVNVQEVRNRNSTMMQAL